MFDNYIAEHIGWHDKPERKELWSRHFALLARDLLWSPPISHRSEPSVRKLSVFEFAVAAGVIALVRPARREARHKFAMGGKSKAGYKREAAAFNKQALPTVELVVSRAALLRIVGLSDGGKNFANMADALDRLLKMVRVGDRIAAPLLRSWSTLRNGDVKLRVNARSQSWLPKKAFDAVPLPLPTRSSVALALYLFLHGCDLREDPGDGSGLPSIRTKTLYSRIGATKRRDLYRALDIINRHLRRQNAPYSFERVKLRGNKLRFQLGKPVRIEAERLEHEFSKGKGRHRREAYA